MDLKQLTYFLEIIKEENITKAAEKLHIAQPHLSHQLKLLEDELNTKLIQRTTRKFQITEAGELLQKRGEQMINLLKTTIKELNDINEGITGTLSVGTISAKGDTLLLKKINEFHKAYPNVNFIIKECNTMEILELLKVGLIEIGIVRTPFNSNEVESIHLPSEPMIAVYCNDTYFNDNKNSINISELKDKPLLISSKFENMLLDVCEVYNFKPRILCQINDARSLLLWASTGMGIAIVPKDWIDISKNINLKYSEINEPSLITRSEIIWTKNHYLSSVANHFLETFI
ncbi:LysR family transcriptional regulator [Clostridium gelidum]|uniref:LysR family transcriptional regulator n=1 Tax=Clostridium gelidum TaxID=704125 RepID=A0ABN6IWQ0_9CLOT|nr:LysR family transcriptional regulator [Clostridium gelidum]BCZ45121.1 LysR family transcriptional regulator [Clostridium gelidum]